jgi:recombinational DNA repair protein (RecF pathway)
LAIANCELIYHYFLWNLFSFLGYEIDLYYCVVCQKKLSPLNLYFSVEEGGIVCGDCLGRAARFAGASARRAKCGVISADIIKIIRLFLEKDWKTLSKIKIEKTYLDSLSLISESCLSYYKKTE